MADLKPELIQLAPPDSAMDVSIWVLTHPDLRQVSRIRALTEFVFDTLDDEGTLR